ncbi:hypothetical protein FDECE_2566 [Fusarium decemcellulare]|nr:hypothetical protein FDECE_2566 [Fusarium decemcellulare]
MVVYSRPPDRNWISAVGNTLNYGRTDWEADINAAKTAGIEAFAMNMAKDEKANDNINVAFDVASAAGFKLFFSFDYAGNGNWEKAQVISLLNKWKSSSAYYKRGSQPLASTFEGVTSASDWADIKSATGCFFVPDYSSLGAYDALRIAPGVPDGLFNWAAWPTGPRDMNTYTDASYMQFIAQAGRSTYMMPVSPGFYTNLPGYDKNWLWRGDDLWFDRWVQVLFLSRVQTDFEPPEFAQIISWNDYGESHYIGGVNPKALGAFEIGRAPFNYAKDIDHDGYRMFLPFLIKLAKTGAATVGTQGVAMWYRDSPGAACDAAGTVGDSCTHLQIEYPPGEIVQDKVFFSALLGAPAAVTVTVGGVSLDAAWTDVPATGVGIYHGSASFAGKTGQVVVSVNGIASVKGTVPIGGCTRQNFNPHVYAAEGPGSSASLNINDHVCVAGFGVGGFQNICKFTCGLGYCPVTACSCSKIGPKPKMPTALQKDGYPADGNRILEGLCSFAVNYGYTGKECSTKKPGSMFTPSVSPFFPDTTTGGTGASAKYNDMCQFSCRYGWCPLHLCTPTSTGVLIPHPAYDLGGFGQLRSTLSLDERLLCRFSALFNKASTDVCFEPPPPPPPPPPQAPSYTWWVVPITANQGIEGSPGDSLPIPTIYEEYHIYDRDPDCHDFNNALAFQGEEDLSHDGDVGIRCEGCGTDTSEPTEMEIRTDHGHWTWYANRNGAIVEAGTNKVVGKCVLDDSIDISCVIPGFPVGNASGTSELRCTADFFPNK